MSKTHTVVSNFAWSLMNSFSLFVSSIVLSIILPRILGEDVYGQYAYLIWLYTVIALICSFGVGQTVTKFVSQWSANNQLAKAGAIVRLFLIPQLSLIAAFAAILWTSPQLVNQILSSNIASIHLSIVALIVIPVVLNMGLVATLQGLHRYRQQGIAATVSTIIYSLLALAIVFTQPSITNLLLAMLANQLILFICYVYSLRDIIAIPGKIKDLNLSVLIKFALGIYFISILDAVVWQRSEIFFLEKFSVSSQVGFYALSYGLVTTSIFFVINAFNSVLVPIFTRIKYSDDPNATSVGFYRLTKMAGLIAIPAATGFAMLAPSLIDVLLGPEYQPMAVIIRILSIAVAVSAITGAASALQFAHEKIGFAIKLGVILAVVNIALDFWLISNYDAIGAAIANTTVQVLGVMIGTTYMCRILNLKFPGYDLVRISLAAALMAISIGLLEWLRLPHILLIILAIPLGFLVYIGGIVAFRVFDRTDILMINSVDLTKIGPLSPIAAKLLARLDGMTTRV